MKVAGCGKGACFEEWFEDRWAFLAFFMFSSSSSFNFISRLVFSHDKLELINPSCVFSCPNHLNIFPPNSYHHICIYFELYGQDIIILVFSHWNELYAWDHVCHKMRVLNMSSWQIVLSWSRHPWPLHLDRNMALVMIAFCLRLLETLDFPTC